MHVSELIEETAQTASAPDGGHPRGRPSITPSSNPSDSGGCGCCSGCGCAFFLAAALVAGAAYMALSGNEKPAEPDHNHDIVTVGDYRQGTTTVLKPTMPQ